MFDRLRKQFIFTTMTIVSVVLIIAFGVIYVSTANNFNRPPEQSRFRNDALRFERFDSEARIFIEEQRQEYAERSLRELLATLLVAGVVTLIAVYYVSRFAANRAVGVIEEAYTRQRQFIADASHELKTPITIIGTNADAAILDTKKPSKWLANIKSESERMGRLVNDLLQLARLDTKLEENHASTFDVSKLLSDIADNFSVIATKNKIEIIRKLTKPAEVISDIDKVHQVLNILIENAIKYTEPGNQVTLVSEVYRDSVRLKVINSHKQIGSDELVKFFDRFYQADKSHHSEGYGLGLAIAKEIVEQLGCSLSASSTKRELCFTLVFPRTQNGIL